MAEQARLQTPRKTDVDVLASDVGQRIHAERIARGMSLAQLGGEDLSRSFLSLVEKGKSRISLRALTLVADRLQLPISHFLADAPSLAAVELAIDRAEVALAQQNPGESLRLLEPLDIPHNLRLRALMVHGDALVEDGRPKAAVPILHDALSLARTSGDPHHEAEVMYHLGRALYKAGNLDEALPYFRGALEAVTRTDDDPVLLGKITIYIGHILFVHDEVDNALQQYSRARDLFGAFGDLNSLGCIYSALSLAYDRKGDMPNALRYSKLSLATFEARQDLRQAARELNNLAVKYQELGDISQALDCANQAVERAQAVHAPDIEALARGTLAMLYLRQGDLEAAVRQAELVERTPEASDTPAQVSAWTVLAEVAELNGDHPRTDSLYARALESLKEKGWQLPYAEKALAYSLLLRRRGDTDRALDYALQAAQARATAS